VVSLFSGLAMAVIRSPLRDVPNPKMHRVSPWRQTPSTTALAKQSR
jgi:hypothetical protein